MTPKAGLPPGWSGTTLGEVVVNSRPRVQPREKPEFPFIGMEHVEAHTMRLLGSAPATTMKSNAVHFLPGDVLYGRLRPYLNKVLRPDFEGLCSAEFIPLTPRTGVYPDYIKYLLNAAHFVHFASHLDEGDRPRVDYAQIAKYELPLAPSAEQERIVSAIETQFTRLDAAVTTLERVQANLKRYRASVLKAAVEGRLVPTEAELARREGRDYEPASVLLERILKERRRKWEEAELAKMKANGKPPKGDAWKSKYQGPASPDASHLPSLPTGWTWTTVDQLLENHDSVRVPVKQADRAKRRGKYPYYGASGIIDSVDDFLFDGSYLLVGEDGANLLARTKPIAFQAHGQFWVNNHAHVLKTYLGLPLGFMEACFNATDLARYVTGTAQPKLPQAAMNRMPLPLAPEAEQHRIVEAIDYHLSMVEEVGTQVAANERKCGRLRQSVLKSAFEGRLVDQDPTDEPASVLLERIRADRENGDTRRPTSKPRGRRKKVTA